MSEVSLVTTVGLDPILLHHFIKHYKSIGVDNFYVVVWGDSDRVKYDEIVEVLDTHGLEVYEDLRDTQSGVNYFLTDTYNRITSTKPNDWWIVADLDEFVIFPKPLKQFIDEINTDFVHVLMLDRIGENGEISELKYDDNIWEIYPNVGFMSLFIRKNCLTWCGLIKGKINLTVGQHDLIHDEPVNKKIVAQVHNFTWKKSDIEKTKYYKDLWKNDSNNWIGEYINVENYFDKISNIDIDDFRFRVERCPNDIYESYKPWKEIVSTLRIGGIKNE